MVNVANPPLVSGLAELAAEYPVLLCDVWGVLHDGVRAYPEACAALIAYRHRGGTVILLTNAPRPKAGVVVQLGGYGVPTEAYDDIVTSGDAAREALAARPGARVFHVGADRDLPIYAGLPIELTGEADCEVISCMGLFDDDRETPDDYADRLAAWRARDLPMICANPDIVVERGTRLIWCAGALAERYRLLGGQTTVIGKPFPAVYEAALSRVNPRPAKARVLALGDGLRTDIRGAYDNGFDVAFVTGGIHAGDFGERHAPDLGRVSARLAAEGLGARAVMAHLVWGPA
jgi:HAD superfamily hydrolase (TIGR01459 family)